MKFKDLKQTLRPNTTVNLILRDVESDDDGGSYYMNTGTTILEKDRICKLDEEWFIPGYFDDYAVIDMYLEYDTAYNSSYNEYYLVIIIMKDGT